MSQESVGLSSFFAENPDVIPYCEHREVTEWGDSFGSTWPKGPLRELGMLDEDDKLEDVQARAFRTPEGQIGLILEKE